jgi:tRNA(Ser,Leu) C12 N-acetylase TAN1
MNHFELREAFNDRLVKAQENLVRIENARRVAQTNQQIQLDLDRLETQTNAIIEDLEAKMFSFAVRN